MAHGGNYGAGPRKRSWSRGGSIGSATSIEDPSLMRKNVSGLFGWFGERMKNRGPRKPTIAERQAMSGVKRKVEVTLPKMPWEDKS